MKKENIMIALEIKITKNIMNALLLSEQFDTFLVEEAVITTYNTFHIDGHLVKNFYSSEEWEQLENNELSATFSCWRDIRPVCFQLIKGKKTPVSFKVMLHAAPALLEKIAANPECGVAASLIRSLVLNIRYDNGKVTCITGRTVVGHLCAPAIVQFWA